MTETLETLGKRIATTEDLRSVVRTMKSLSAVSIRQYEQAVAALGGYSRTVELGLHVVLRGQPVAAPETGPAEGLTAAIVFGSDQGLCGRFNEQIARFARADLARRRIAAADTLFLAIGVQAATHLEATGARVDECFFHAGAVAGLTTTAHSVLGKVDAWRTSHRVARVLVFRNRRVAGATAEPAGVQLLPLDPEWLRPVGEAAWPSHVLPTFSMNGAALFSSLVRQHLFVTLFQAGAESLASEHATRLASMQAAERNIQEHLEEMNAAYRHQRQESITAELLDVVAGFETLRTADARGADHT